MIEKLILCKLKKGNDYKYAWVVEHLAKIGTSVIVRDIDTNESDGGWWVIRTRKNKVRYRVADDSKEGDRQLVA